MGQPGFYRTGTVSFYISTRLVGVNGQAPTSATQKGNSLKHYRPPSVIGFSPFTRRLGRSLDKLCNIFYGEEYKRCVGELRNDDLMSLVDYLDKALDTLDPSSFAFRKCLWEFRNICGTRTVLPTSHTLSPSVINIDHQPVASGGSGDIFKGTLNGSEVCVKRVRIYSKGGPDEAIKTLYQQAVVWKRLVHPNIVPLLGVTPNPLQLISGWMPGGDLTDYIKKHSDADRVGLLSDIAQGLHFLHSCNIIHGDLKGPNILVDATGHARITDFDLATVARNFDSARSSGDHGHTARWTAPEILSEEASYSKEADVFAFAMVAIEVFTGAVPFNNGLPAAAMLAIMGGRRPPRPIHPALTEQLWTLIQQCWYQDPNRRPEISEVLKVLGGSEPSPIKPPIYGPGSVMEHYEDEEFPFPQNRPSNNGTDRISRSSSELALSLDPPPVNLAKIATEYQRRPDQAFIDRIDEMLDDVICDRDRHELLNILCKVCNRQRMVPKSMHVENCLNGELIEEYNGGYATVFRGEHKGRPVAVKTIRIYLTSDFGKCLGEFCREAVAWGHLRHPNILPLLGVNLEQHRLAMISGWMDHGNINEFVMRCEGVNRVQLLVDAANGLEHIHSLHMVHGDLKGANILINRNCRACLADFGLSTIIGTEHHAAANASLISGASASSLMSFTAGGTTRWMSPELLYPEGYGPSDGRPTKQSDCYALGMVVYEVLCGDTPYCDITNEGAVINAIMKGYRPRKPEAAENLGFTKGLWGIVQQCWLADANERPDIRGILSHLNHATWAWERKRLV